MVIPTGQLHANDLTNGVMIGNPNSLFSYEVLVTGDGSPTLSISGGEKMHSMEGALSETLYIYGPTIEAALKTQQPRILSMGLGLGYNEMLTAAHLISWGCEDFRLCSFESLEPLRQQFLQWVAGKTPELAPIYDDICRRMAMAQGIDAKAIKCFLEKSASKKRWFLLEALPVQNPHPWRFNGILYDAFSGETDAELWTPEHLKNFLAEFADENSCCLSTYAATGHLKRALKSAGFTWFKREGFGKKRESSYATQGQLFENL